MGIPILGFLLLVFAMFLFTLGFIHNKNKLASKKYYRNGVLSLAVGAFCLVLSYSPFFKQTRKHTVEEVTFPLYIFNNGYKNVMNLSALIEGETVLHVKTFSKNKYFRKYIYRESDYDIVFIDKNYKSISGIRKTYTKNFLFPKYEEFDFSTINLPLKFSK